MCHEFITPLSVVVAYMRAFLGYPQSDTFIIILNITFQKVDFPTWMVDIKYNNLSQLDIITFFCAREASVAQQLNGT